MPRPPKYRSIPLKRAREIGYDWHGGQDSPLYSFASTGKIWGTDHRARLLREIGSNIVDAKLRLHGHTAADERDLEQLLNYVTGATLEQPAHSPRPSARGQRTRTEDSAMKDYRIYADGREFGINYSRAGALQVAARYRKMFPDITYRVRKITTRHTTAARSQRTSGRRGLTVTAPW